MYNQAAIRLCYNPEIRERTKHFCAEAYYARLCVTELKLFTMCFVSTNEQAADLLTKALHQQSFETCLYFNAIGPEKNNSHPDSYPELMMVQFNDILDDGHCVYCKESVADGDPDKFASVFNLSSLFYDNEQITPSTCYTTGKLIRTPVMDSPPKRSSSRFSSSELPMRNFEEATSELCGILTELNLAGHSGEEMESSISGSPEEYCVEVPTEVTKQYSPRHQCSSSSDDDDVTDLRRDASRRSSSACEVTDDGGNSKPVHHSPIDELVHCPTLSDFDELVPVIRVVNEHTFAVSAIKNILKLNLSQLTQFK